MHTLFCVCPPRVESLFPPVLSKSWNQIPLYFKVWFSRNSSSHCWTPRLGSLTWGSVPSLQWVDFCGISVLQSVSHPRSSYGIWFCSDCAPPTVSLWLLLCLWMWGIFLVSSSVFLLMTVQQVVVILVFSQEGVRARPFTPPSWFRLALLFWTHNFWHVVVSFLFVSRYFLISILFSLLAYHLFNNLWFNFQTVVNFLVFLLLFFASIHYDQIRYFA